VREDDEVVEIDDERWVDEAGDWVRLCRRCHDWSMVLEEGTVAEERWRAVLLWPPKRSTSESTEVDNSPESSSSGEVSSRRGTWRVRRC